MANEFIARNGIFALSNSQVTGSLSVTNGITGSLFGTASWALNTPSASVAQIANIVDFREADNSTSRLGNVPIFGQGIAVNDVVYTTATQTDGKIIVGGTFVEVNGSTRNRLVRLNSDGTEDTSFYTNLGSGFNGVINSIALQSDGKILVGGTFTTLNAVTRNRLVRLNSDGTVDTSFSTNLGSGFGNQVSTIVVQSDGKILVGGAFTTLNAVTRNRLVRLNSDGTLDTSFSTNLGTGFNGAVNSIALQSDGKIVVGGGFSTLDVATRIRLVRLNSDGTEDTSFYTNLGSGFNDQVYSVAIQSDGRILVGGLFTTLNAVTRNRFLRLNSDGTVDTTFYTNLGSGFTNLVYSVAIQSDGKILVGGFFSQLNGNQRWYIVRLNSDGTEDTTFYTNLGSGFGSLIYHVAVQSDGKILVGGAYNTFKGNNTLAYFVRLASDGTVDPTDYITSTTLRQSSFSQAQGGTVTISNTLSTGTITNSTLNTAYINNSGPYVSSANFSTISQNVTDQVMYSYAVGSFYAAMIEMHIFMGDGSFRLTQLNIANDANGNYTYTEQSTSDIGNTTPITINIVYDTGGSEIQVRATNTSSDYDATFRAYVRLINI